MLSLIRTFFTPVFVLLAVMMTMTFVDAKPASAESSKRVPAEWEEQEAIWLQWPGRWEKTYEPAFAEMSKIISSYQKLHILYDSPAIMNDARTAITRAGGDPDNANLIWHEVGNNSAWMRDNGPVYVIEDGAMTIQNWEFDAWGGAFGADIPFDKDNRVPQVVGEIADIPVEHADIVHERGNLEFNGVDTVMLNWSVIGDSRRNRGYTRDEAEAYLKEQFGVSKVVFIEGVPKGDLTNGHIDGIARFISPTTVVVADCTGQSQCLGNANGNDAIFDAAAETIEAAGFTVIREPIEATARYQGQTFDTNYMNWLVGNGFVITVGFGNAEADAAAKARIETYFPGRDVYVIEMLDSWAAGGGVHCHTNDQPAMSTINASMPLE